VGVGDWQAMMRAISSNATVAMERYFILSFQSNGKLVIGFNLPTHQHQ